MHSNPSGDGWRTAAVLVFLAGLLTSGLAAVAFADSEDEPRGYAFVHASVVPMVEERVLADQTVVIQQGRIHEIGPSDSTPVPEGMTQIDAEDRYLIPALCDMHVHLINEAWGILLPSGASAPEAKQDLTGALFLYLANGVTTVQVLAATPEDLALRERIGRGEVLGPRLVLARLIDGPEKAWPPPLSTWVASPEEARAAVLEAKEAGYDAMKAYSFLDQASYDAIAATTREVGMDLIGHIPMELSLKEVIKADQRLIAHSEEVMKHAGGDFSQQNIERLATTLAEAGTWIIPTLVTSRNIVALFEDHEAELARPEAVYFQHPVQQGAWSFIVQNLYMPTPPEHRQAIRAGFEQFQLPFTKALHERGGKLLAGTDAGLPVLVPGFAVHRELEELVGVGLTPYEALATSTTLPFEYLGELDEAGTVQVGRRADLVLLDENPLADIRNTRRIAGVMIRGLYLPREEIKDRLAALRAE